MNMLLHHLELDGNFIDLSELNVNIDHVATLRQARLIDYPSPVEAALLAEKAGAKGIVAHLREDRRHIQDSDIYELRDKISTRLDLEMAHREDIINIAIDVKPELVTLVPESREELTTEGGMDVGANISKYSDFTKQMHDANIKVSFFIEPDIKAIDNCLKCGVDMVELHTGHYVNLRGEKQVNELQNIISACKYSKENDLELAVGHGLNVNNLSPIAEISGINEFSIGHAIISRAVFIGLENAVREIIEIIEK